ncbi:arginyltransferase [Methylovirgula sp. 4M-Z18]|uniref:arginyltransferase n=1 Tax=Methylovirgula sp. 4M-Z18 TaxID=2293567 RepID=UPI000E2F78D5|nr:arginyltransferase [Methylovirgula sp. 4M-Z18]RFB80620.1 arginyltransferase [Methylovirgula sp. 4M-Z18]
MTQEPRNAPQFYLTEPSSCPYLPDRKERKVFTHLIGRRAAELNDTLSHHGFRRSQTIAYRPACEYCSACVSVRVRAQEFVLSRNMRKVIAANRDLIGCLVPNVASIDHYALFRRYLDSRHSDGGMADMGLADFTTMIEDSHVSTHLVEYRDKDPVTGEARPGYEGLAATALIDVLSDGLSMVYSFYRPQEEHRSLGTYMILDQIERARAMDLPYVYLGYWVEGSRKMAYKARFLPQERLGVNGWVLVG